MILDITHKDDSTFPSDIQAWKELGRRIKRDDTISEFRLSLDPQEVDSIDQSEELYQLGLRLRENRSIRSLYFSNILFRRQSLFFMLMGEFLANNHNMTKIHLKSCKATSYHEWSLFTKGIISCETLTHLTIEDIHISGRLFPVVAPAFGGKLIKLGLKKCGINNKNIESLTASWYIEDKTPRILDISDNPIGTDACHALSSLPFERLIMDGTPIRNEGIYALFEPHLIPRRNRTFLDLTSLHLQATEMGNSACQQIATFLKNRRCSLETLNLSSNGIGDRGLRKLICGIRENETLHTLSLSNNQKLTSEGWSAVLKLLCDESSIDATHRSNHTLRTLRGPSIGFYRSETGAKISEMLRVNSQAKMLECSRKDDNFKPTASNIAAARKITKAHLVTLYNEHRSESLCCTPNHIVVNILEWIRCYYGGGTSILTDVYGITAFYQIVKHNPHLMQIELGKNREKHLNL